ncbi:hypothetical protein PAJ34TS1_39350 [Paenibacillus azoreducens]|uniref:Uncharacterized protein n=1 Tax=Paenibacillus azoreducens TaxID=116718 RepID=A0A920CLW2_9BACL|nr:hypothetical protein J34TS1_03160 [Paenibacillus azoreducens]
MKTKWNNEFFARIRLVPAFWVYYNAQYGYTLDDYMDFMKNKQKTKQVQRKRKASERGEAYYTPERVRKIQYAQRLATTY